MSYATASELVTAFGANELAQMATPKRFPVVDDERLELAIEGEELPELGEDEEDDTEALAACLATIALAIASADGLIDSYLASRYSLPLVSTPAVLKEAALDLARYELHKERATEEVRDRRKEVVAWLRDLSSGKARLGVPAIDSAAGASGISIVPSAGRTFTATTLEAFGA